MVSAAVNVVVEEGMAVVVPSSLATVLQAPAVRQQAFGWRRDAWAAPMHDLPDVLAMLTTLAGRVDRHTTRDLVLTELDADRVLSAFVAAMVWGHGTRGYGPTRVRQVLTGVNGRASLSAPVRADVPSKLSDAVDIVRGEGPLGAYRFMYGAGRIKDLGDAFFTKWLYFTSALTGPDASEAAPILDKRVAVWLRDVANVKLRLGRSDSYRRYLELLDNWGSQYNRTRVQVEQAIFELTRT